MDGKKIPGILASLFISVTSSISVVASPQQDYLRGYAEAVLDMQSSVTGVRVETVSTEGQVWLAADDCLETPVRDKVVMSMQDSGRFSRVTWIESADCTPPAVVAADNEEAVPGRKKISVEMLPVKELFRPLIADPRQPQFSIRYHAYDSQVDSFNAASVSYGDYFGFVSGLFGDESMSQLGLQGAVFAVFNLDSDSFDLVNADYWIGLPVTYRKGNWSFLARIYHQSSHLGDEFLLGNPGINRINLSYEDLEFIASHDWPDFGLRAYLGGGVLLHSEPDLDPWHSQAGLEYRSQYFPGNWELVAATDIQAYEESAWRLNRSYQLGFAFHSDNERELRLMLEHFRGRSPNGQFYKERLRYSGVGIYFDF